MAHVVKDKASDETSASANSALTKALRAMHQLTFEEKVQLLEFLSRSLQHDIKLGAYKDISWEEFLEMTYGSLADDPIELPDRFKAQAQDASQ